MELAADFYAALSKGIEYAQFGTIRAAIEQFQIAIDTGETSRIQHDGSPIWIRKFGNALAQAYEQLGLALRKQGDLPEADQAYVGALQLSSQLRNEHSSSAEWLQQFGNDLASTHMNRGVGLRHAGRSIDAEQEHTKAVHLVSQLRTSMHDSDEWVRKYGNEFAGTYVNLGVTQRSLGKFEEVESSYFTAISIRKRLRHLEANSDGWIRLYGNDLARAHVNRGVALRNLNRLHEANAEYSEAIDLREEIRTINEGNSSWLHKFGNDLAKTYGNRGVVRYYMEQFRDAAQDFSTSISLRCEFRAMQGDVEIWTRMHGAELARAYINRGATKLRLNDSEDASSDFSSARSILAYLLELRPHTVGESAVLALCWSQWSSSNFAGMMASEVRLQSSSLFSALRRQLEIAPLRARASNSEWDRIEKRSSTFALSAFRYALIHADYAWALECLQQLHGRAMLQDTLDAVDLASEEPALLVFQQRRRDLARIRQQLIDALNRPISLVGDPGSDLNKRAYGASVEPSNHAQRLQADYQPALRDYESARSNAAQVPGFEALNPSTFELTLDQLHEAVPDQHATILLVEGTDNHPAQALILDAGRASHVAFSDLPLLATRLESVQRALETGDTFRRAGTMQQSAPSSDPLDFVSRKLTIAETDTDEPIVEPVAAFLDLASALKDSFWIPLLAALPKDTTTVHLVTHGQLHNLPFASQTPAHITLYQYPGLVMFGQQHDLYPNMTIPGEQRDADRALGLIAFPGTAHTYLDLVDAEHTFLTQLWGADNVINDWSADPFAFGHVACHGDNRKGVHDNLHNEGVLLIHDLAHPAPFLGAREVRALPFGLPDELFINACLTGQVSDDRTGTPTGLLVALMRRGARAVVGALTPIPDHAAAWFGMLIHAARKDALDRTGDVCPLPVAFSRAKHAILNPADPLNLPVRTFMDQWATRWREDFKQRHLESGRPPIPPLEAQRLTDLWRNPPQPVEARFICTSLVLFGRGHQLH